MKAQREALPIFSHRAELLSAIRTNQVVIVEGDTGCGKTTQVPQYVLEEAADAGIPFCALCTQPRRISALGVSARVAAERAEAVGGTVGYSIRLDSRASASTCLLFCTNGILTRRLEEDPELTGVTHVFMDEARCRRDCDPRDRGRGPRSRRGRDLTGPRSENRAMRSRDRFRAGARAIYGVGLPADGAARPSQAPR